MFLIATTVTKCILHLRFINCSNMVKVYVFASLFFFKEWQDALNILGQILICSKRLSVCLVFIFLRDGLFICQVKLIGIRLDLLCCVWESRVVCSVAREKINLAVIQKINMV